MGLVANIRAALSGVACKFADGTIEYRTLTSAPNAATRTYSAWSVIPYARIHNTLNEQIRDPDSGMWYFLQTCELRVPFEAGILLNVFCQVRSSPPSGVDTTNQVWSVKKEVSTSAGAVSAYELIRREPILGDGRKGGGV